MKAPIAKYFLHIWLDFGGGNSCIFKSEAFWIYGVDKAVNNKLYSYEKVETYKFACIDGSFIL